MAEDKQELTVAGLRSLAQTFSDKARQCEEIAKFLETKNMSIYWQSRKATQYKQKVADYTKQLRIYGQVFRNASDAVTAKANDADTNA